MTDAESSLNSESQTNILKINENVPFKLQWVFGYDTKVPPINISSSTVKGIFFCAGAIGVCYDWTKRTQMMLYGHANPIVSTAVTSDKTYLASADSGRENSLIIWQRKTGKMVFILSNYFPEEGVTWMCFSEDGKILLTLTGGTKQHFATFHHKDSNNFASCSKENVYFFKWNGGKVKSSVLNLSSLYDEKGCRRVGYFTQTVFSPISSLAYTATTKGMMVLWGNVMSNERNTGHSTKLSWVMEPEERICLRAMQILNSRCSLSFLSVMENLLVAGTELGQVCYFDKDFKLQWSMDITDDEICSVSFNFKPRLSFKQAVFRAIGKDFKKDDAFEKNDFIVVAKKGFVGYVTVVSSEINEVLYGTSGLVKDVAVHPLKPYFYIGDNNGGLQKWDYKSKKLLNKGLYQGPCSEIECLSIDSKGTYIACAMSSGEVVIFDAISFAAKPCFTSHEIKQKLTFIKFSPDPQHLIVTDAISNVHRYQLFLLVPPVLYQMMKKASLEEPVWGYSGKTKQHRGRIKDCMFNDPLKDENIYFLTLGEDCLVVVYNISNSKNMDISVHKRIALDEWCTPICMAWYPLYDLRETISVLSDDGRLRIYSIRNEEMIKIVALPSFEEPFQRMVLLKNITINQNESFPSCLVFHTAHSIGMAKFPIDGNPYSILAVSSHPKGINSFMTNNENMYLFSAGIKDSWIYVYEINPVALLDSERKGGIGIDAFKGLFPTNEDSEEMKKRLIYSVYSLEMEMKMLKLGADQCPELQGEIPVNFLEYVMAALGCFLSPSELQIMLNDVNFENKYLHEGKKSTLNCLDIMKLYISYRPKDPLTKDKVRQTFKEVLLSNGDPDEISRAQFLNILKTRGNPIPTDELLNIVKCLKDYKFEDSSNETKGGSFSEIHEPGATSKNLTKEDDTLINEIIPEAITEEIFLRDILNIEDVEEDLSGYILEREDFKLKPEHLTVEDFVLAMKANELPKN